MDEGPYFQWQNEALLGTIYPLRKMKLRDFLVYFREVELWVEYQDRSQESLVNEINDYIKAQTESVEEMKQTFAERRDYFLSDITLIQEPAALLSPQVVVEIENISKLHKTCRDYLPNYHDLRKEKIFMSQRFTEWEEHSKDLSRRLSRKPDADKDILKIVEEELTRLRELLTYYNKIDTRRTELIKPRKENTNRRWEITLVLDPLKVQIKNQLGPINELEDLIKRIQARPNFDVVKQHYSLTGIFDRFNQTFKGGDATWFVKITGIWKMLNQIVTKTAGLNVMLVSIKNEIGDVKRLKSDVERRIADLEAGIAKMTAANPNDPRIGMDTSTAANLRDFNLNAIVKELDELSDLRVALEFIYKKSDQQIEESLQTQRNELLRLQNVLAGPQAKANQLQQELAAIDEFLKKSNDDNLLNFISDSPMEPSKVTKKDIVNAKIENYRKELSAKELPELLEIIVHQFVGTPEKYPLWLQYMVIHFSGMRYASAHGSWADPRDLLINLGSTSIADYFDKEEDDWIQACCDEKIDCYKDPLTAMKEPGLRLPKMLQVLDPNVKALEPRDRWMDKIAGHLQALQSDKPYQRRKALIDLLIDESTYEVESLTNQEVLDSLRILKDFLSLPDWMWKEVVKLTELRITEVKKDNDDNPNNDDAWEKPVTISPEDAKDENFVEYKQIMNQWKQSNLTSWREEHEESDRLIVTRAVCNEVAEHIQHLRGHHGAAGLTQKPNWYIREDKRFGKPLGEQQDDKHPYFLRPKVAENYKNDFQVGASILWLRFVNKEPNDWQIAIPLETRGDRLVSDVYRNGKKDDPAGWTYDEDGKSIQRHRKEPHSDQWLRWMHEATVAKVAETADGPTVLTFETALPNEDRRLSTIGIFKRSVTDLLFDFGEDGYNPSFLGFVPEGGVSAEDIDEFADDADKFLEKQKKFVENLEFMLDWNKILQRTIMTPEELDAWQEKNIRSKIPTAPPKLPPGEESMPATVMMHPPITNVENRPAPMRAWRVKWDWEEVTDYGTSVRKAAPDPCVFRCGELEDNKNGHYVELTEAWQRFWFELCCKVAFGCYSKSLSERKRIWMGNRWEALGGNWTAFTNQHGLDVGKNFVLGERLDKNYDFPMIYTLVGGGATLTGEVVTNSNGVEMLKVDHFPGHLGPPSVDSIDPYADPRIFFANIITRKEVKDTAKNTIGYRVVRFPQFRGKEAPVPLIANTDIYYPLCDLEEITTGIKAPAYFP